MCAIYILNVISDSTCSDRYLWSRRAFLNFADPHHSPRLGGDLVLRKQWINRSFGLPFIRIYILNIELVVRPVSWMILFKWTWTSSIDSLSV